MNHQEKKKISLAPQGFCTNWNIKKTKDFIFTSVTSWKTTSVNQTWKNLNSSQWRGGRQREEDLSFLWSDRRSQMWWDDEMSVKELRALDPFPIMQLPNVTSASLTSKSQRLSTCTIQRQTRHVKHLNWVNVSPLSQNWHKTMNPTCIYTSELNVFFFYFFSLTSSFCLFAVTADSRAHCVFVSWISSEFVEIWI